MKSRRTLWWVGGVLVAAGLGVYFWPRDAASPPAAAVAVRQPIPAPAAARPPVSAVAGREMLASREVLAANWKTDTHPACAAFRDWTARYLATSPAERAKLLAEGLELARQRREVMARLIRTDPRAALAAAVPMVVRQQLPAAVVDLLEDRVSGRGNLALNAVTPLPGQTVAQSTFRSVVIGDQEYTAYVYGRRESQATVSSTSIVGIAVDHALAVSESPLRVLEPGEIAADRPFDQVCAISGNVTPADPATPLNVAGEATAVEYNGKVQLLCHIAHVTALEKQLYASEVDHIQVLGDNQPGTSGVTGRPVASWTHGPKKMLVIRVDFSDLQGTPLNTYIDNQPITPTTINNIINGTNGVNSFYTNGSYNQSSIVLTPPDGTGNSVDVTSVLRMPSSASSYATAGNNGQLHIDAESAATTAGYNVAGYDRVGVVFTSLASIPGSQINYGGLGEVIGTRFWVNGEFDLRVVAHEVGHNYGLNHANLWQVNDGNPISPNGTSVEYGDNNDVMGSGNTYLNEFTHWNKSILQWIPDSGVTPANAAGTYRIYRLDGGAASNLSNPRALKIVRDSTTDYWIGFRPGDGNTSLANGAYIIWGYNTNRQGNLLDMTTPGTNVNDAGLAIGTTFNDTVAGISITPLAQGGSGSEEYLDVQVGFLAKVQWSQGTYSVDEQSGNATLTLNRTQNNVGTVSVNYATANGTATAPANYAASSGTVSWADGDMADKTVTIPLVAGAATGGTQSFTVTLSGVTSAVLGSNTVATVTIVDPGVRDAGFNADFVNSTVQKVLPQPDGSMILGGWFYQEQDASFTNYPHGGVVRLTAAGAVDPVFTAGAGAAGGYIYGNNQSVVFDLARQPDGKIIAVGEFATYNGTAFNRIVRLNPDGTVDTSFNPGTGADNTIYTVLVQPDGRIFIGGAFLNYNGAAHAYLVRLNPDGSLDTSFAGPDFGTSGGGWLVQCLALQPDGRLLVGGSYYLNSEPNFSLCRVLPTGALDTTFNGINPGANYPGIPGAPGFINKVVVQPDGQILIAGYFDGYNGTASGNLARLTATGALDGSFAPSADNQVNALLLQPDGSIIIGGGFAKVNGSAASNLARLSSSGVFDVGFASAGGFGSTVDDLALLPNGRVVLGGNPNTFQGSSTNRPVWQFFAGLPALPGTLQFSSATYSGNEGGTGVLSVTRTGGSLGALTVGYATVDGTATGADYTATSGVLTWADGDAATKTINVPLTPAGLTSGTASFTVNLGQPVNQVALLGSLQQASFQINVPLTGFAAWQASNFTAGELSNANISGPNAVYGQDGLPNLVKYALGLAPKQNITTGLPAVSTLAADWVYLYTRPSSVTDVTYTVEISTDLVNWTSTGVTLEFVSTSGGIDTWRGRYPLASAANVFFHLKITQP